ncbi:MAG: GxxExxY protein [Kiritimatiellales bacterium]|nr:GxxExxY protein [Kiritimatiellales bacterium]
MRVHRELGPGWDEYDYHVCIMDELSRMGISAESTTRGVLRHRGKVVDRFELDVIVDSKLILELKHIPCEFVPANYVQLINYLTYWRKSIGILYNFGQEKLRVRRLRLLDKRPSISIARHIRAKTLPIDKLAQVLDVLVTYKYHTFSLPTLNKLFHIEANHHDLSCQQLQVQPTCLGRNLPPRTVDAWKLNEEFIVQLAANRDGPSQQNKAILRYRLKHLNIKTGILINFTPSEISVCTVSQSKTTP